MHPPSRCPARIAEARSRSRRLWAGFGGQVTGLLSAFAILSTAGATPVGPPTDHPSGRRAPIAGPLPAGSGLDLDRQEQLLDLNERLLRQRAGRPERSGDRSPRTPFKADMAEAAASAAQVTPSDSPRLFGSGATPPVVQATVGQSSFEVGGRDLQTVPTRELALNDAGIAADDQVVQASIARLLSRLLPASWYAYVRDHRGLATVLVVLIAASLAAIAGSAAVLLRRQRRRGIRHRTRQRIRQRTRTRNRTRARH